MLCKFLQLSKVTIELNTVVCCPISSSHGTVPFSWRGVFSIVVVVCFNKSVVISCIADQILVFKQGKSVHKVKKP